MKPCSEDRTKKKRPREYTIRNVINSRIQQGGRFSNLIVQGLSDDFRKDAIDIVLGSLGDKIIPAMGGRRKAEILFEQTMDPSCALVAVESGRLTGLIAVKSSEIAFVDAGLWDFVRITGFFRSFWSVPILGLLEHNPGPDELYLDMIVVHPDARGKES